MFSSEVEEDGSDPISVFSVIETLVKTSPDDTSKIQPLTKRDPRLLLQSNVTLLNALPITTFRI